MVAYRSFMGAVQFQYKRVKARLDFYAPFSLLVDDVGHERLLGREHASSSLFFLTSTTTFFPNTNCHQHGMSPKKQSVEREGGGLPGPLLSKRLGAPCKGNTVFGTVVSIESSVFWITKAWPCSDNISAPYFPCNVSVFADSVTHQEREYSDVVC